MNRVDVACVFFAVVAIVMALGIRRLYRGNDKPFAEVFIGSTYAMFALAAVLLVSPFVG
jgi:membrane protein implicated in regulation of membrane protease activity